MLVDLGQDGHTNASAVVRPQKQRQKKRPARFGEFQVPKQNLKPRTGQVNYPLEASYSS